MPSNHLILCCPLLLLPSIFPSIRVFPSESVLCIRWPNYWSFSFSISPSNEYSGLISFRMDWLDLLAVQGTLKHLLQHHSSKASVLQRSSFFMVQLSRQGHFRAPWNRALPWAQPWPVGSLWPPGFGVEVASGFPGPLLRWGAPRGLAATPVSAIPTKPVFSLAGAGMLTQTLTWLGVFSLFAGWRRGLPTGGADPLSLSSLCWWGCGWGWQHSQTGGASACPSRPRGWPAGGGDQEPPPAPQSPPGGAQGSPRLPPGSPIPTRPPPASQDPDHPGPGGARPPPPCWVLLSKPRMPGGPAAKPWRVFTEWGSGGHWRQSASSLGGWAQRLLSPSTLAEPGRRVWGAGRPGGVAVGAAEDAEGLCLPPSLSSPASQDSRDGRVSFSQ